MTDLDELLVLRLALLGIIFGFGLIASVLLARGLNARPTAPATTSPNRAGARLIVISPAQTGLDPGTEFPLAGRMFVGREMDNGIVLPDASVSSRHAQVEWTGRGWFLTDLRSTNGTLLNGRPVGTRRVRLRENEQITFGAVVVRFHA